MYAFSSYFDRTKAGSAPNYQYSIRFMKAKYLAFALFLSFAFVQSCAFNSFEEDVRPPAVDPCDTLQVSFADTIMPIITRSCSNSSNGACHFSGSTGTGLDLTSYAGIKAKVDDGGFAARVFDRLPSAMPPGYSNGPRTLSICEDKLLRRWIEAGAPNN